MGDAKCEAYARGLTLDRDYTKGSPEDNISEYLELRLWDIRPGMLLIFETPYTPIPKVPKFSRYQVDYKWEYKGMEHQERQA